MFSQTTEYALRAVVVLAKSPKKAHTASEIASAARVPLDYMSKVLGCLARTGVVSAQRGRGGGFLLTRPPEDFTVLEVVTAVDPIRRIGSCPLGIAEHGTQLCALHRTLDDALSMIQRVFASTTISSLLSEPTGSQPLCAEKKNNYVAFAD